MEQVCANPPCHNIIIQPKRTDGRPPKRFCSPICSSRGSEKYLANNQRIADVKEYLALGFTREQVLADFVYPDLTLQSFIMLLRRRGEDDLRKLFDPLDYERRNGWAKRRTKQRRAVDAA